MAINQIGCHSPVKSFETMVNLARLVKFDIIRFGITIRM